MKNILMNAEMTKAIFDGHKTQFREVVKKAKIISVESDIDVAYGIEFNDKNGEWSESTHSDFISMFSNYQIGETIFKGEHHESVVTNVRVERLQDIGEDADNFMAEGFSHDTYEIGEALKNKMYSNDTHGECDFENDCMHDWWINLWNKTAPKGYKWEDNPYVFVYTLKRVEK